VKDLRTPAMVSFLPGFRRAIPRLERADTYPPREAIVTR
jgi:hypothetical protein